MEEYVRFWSERPEVRDIWVSLYTPQRGEQSAEMLSAGAAPAHRRRAAAAARLYRKLLTPEGYAKALLQSASVAQGLHLLAPLEKLLGRSADARRALRLWRRSRLLAVRLLGQRGRPTGSARSVAGPLKAKHLLHGSMHIGNAMARLQRVAPPAWRDREQAPPRRKRPRANLGGGWRGRGEPVPLEPAASGS